MKKIDGLKIAAKVFAMQEPLRTKVACVVFWDFLERIPAAQRCEIRELVASYRADVHEVPTAELEDALMSLGFSREKAAQRLKSNYTERMRIIKSNSTPRHRRGRKHKKKAPKAWLQLAGGVA